MCFFSALENPSIEEGGKKWNFKICVVDERKYVCAQSWKKLKTIHCYGKGFLLYLCQGHWMHKPRESTDLEREQLCCVLTAALIGHRRVREFSCHYKTVKYNWKCFFITFGSLRSHQHIKGLAIPLRLLQRMSQCVHAPFPRSWVSLRQKSHCELSFQQLGLLSGFLNSGQSVLCLLVRFGFFSVSALQGSAIEHFKSSRMG